MSVTFDGKIGYIAEWCELPNKCKKIDWRDWYVYTPAISWKKTPETHEHNINTDIGFTAWTGLTIPLIKTTRTLKYEFYDIESIPEEVFDINQGDYLGCEWRDEDREASISEDCTIEKCTIHYLDITERVMLYRYVKEYVKFEGVSTELTAFKGQGGFYTPHKIKIKHFADDSEESHAWGEEEWRLVVNGQEIVIATSKYKIAAMPKGEPEDRCVDLPKDSYTIFVLPPPSLQDEPREKDLWCYGWYTSGDEDGAHRDMFYPSWCRALHEDPLWASARNVRQTFTQATGEREVDMKPPAPTVDPIPKGSFAKHPKLGYVYQWLISDRTNKSYVINGDEESIQISQINELVQGQLDTLSTNGNTIENELIIYPISLV